MLFYTYKRPTILVVIGAIARPKAFLVLTNVSESIYSHRINYMTEQEEVIPPFHLQPFQMQISWQLGHALQPRLPQGVHGQGEADQGQHPIRGATPVCQ